MKNFYQSDQWRKLRAVKLSNDPLCQHCEKRGYFVEANEVDHITPIADDKTLILDYDNLQSLCKSCHSRKTIQENKDKLKPKEVNLMDDLVKQFLK